MFYNRSAQRQAELRQLSKANSLCKIVKWCVFCVFVKLRLNPGCAGPGIKISRDIVAQAKSVWLLDDALHYQLRPLSVGKNY